MYGKSAVISFLALLPPSTLETSRKSPSPEQPRPIRVEERREIGSDGLETDCALPIYLVLEVGSVLSTHLILAHPRGEVCGCSQKADEERYRMLDQLTCC